MPQTHDPVLPSDPLPPLLVGGDVLRPLVVPVAEDGGEGQAGHHVEEAGGKRPGKGKGRDLRNVHCVKQLEENIYGNGLYTRFHLSM